MRYSRFSSASRGLLISWANDAVSSPSAAGALERLSLRPDIRRSDRIGMGLLVTSGRTFIGEASSV